MSRRFSRRRIMGEASCASVGSAALLSSLINLKLVNQAAAAGLTPGDDCKTIVNVLMAGGCDTFNLLLRRDAGYAEYATSRSDLALPNDAALHHLTQISGNDGNEYALHPSCSGLSDLFNGTGTDFAGKSRLAYVANIGTLVHPTSMTQYENQSLALPKSLFSHIDQIEQWQTSVPQGMSELSGYAGRMADVLHSTVNTQATAMSISLAGNNICQIGNTTKQFAVTNAGALLFESTGSWTQEHDLKNAGLASLMEHHYSHLMRDSFAQHTDDSLDAQLAFKAHWDAVEPTFDALTTASFPSSKFGQDLRAAAITIKIRQDLGLRRNSIFINRGGWDHHGELLNTQAGMLTDLSDALYAFQLCLEDIGVAPDVVTFTSSDFGRTLRSNGRGSDHAWGGNQMVMGEPVEGGKVYGTFPSLALDGADDVGKGGRMLPSTSVDEFFAEIARWFGISATDLPYVLPNITNFITPSLEPQPVGFIKAGRIV